MLYDRRRFVLLATATVVASAGGLVLSHAAHAAAGQGNDAAVSLAIFRGQLGDSSNVTLGSWGSGTAESSKQNVLTGDTSIKVTTQGYYQGARLDFKNPIDLAPALLNPHTYVRFQFKFLGDSSTSTTTGDPRSGGGGLEETKQAASPFANMRFLLVMADGERYELIRPVEIPPSEDPDAYSPLAFPVSAIVKQLPAGKTLTGDGAKIKQMAIFGDRYAQFLIGEINVITDETDITAAPMEAPIAFAKQEVTLIANAEGGASTLHYSWDWDADDGIQEDSTGRVGKHTYQPSGKGSKTYKVTLTITDVDGLKKPAVETVDLDVSD